MENINIPHSAPKQSASIQKLNESTVSRAFAFFPWAQNIKHSSENSNHFLWSCDWSIRYFPVWRKQATLYSTRERAVCTERHKCLQLLHNYSKFHDNHNNNDSTIHNQFGTYIHIPTFPYKTKNRHTYHVKLFADRFSQATFHAKAVQECEKDVLW